MPTDTLHAAKPSLAYAKLVATPTQHAWSQVYNAGNLFASISLAMDNTEGDSSLAVIGKDIINNLEAEFFTLEEKTLESIKTALKDSIKNVPENITLSICLSFFKDAILYLFIVGEGKILMKRQEKIGVLLHGQGGHTRTVHTASGYLENQDIILLQTKQFGENIPAKTFSCARTSD